MSVFTKMTASATRSSGAWATSLSPSASITTQLFGPLPKEVPVPPYEHKFGNDRRCTCTFNTPREFEECRATDLSRQIPPRW